MKKARHKRVDAVWFHYVKLKNCQNLSLLLEVRMVVSQRWEMKYEVFFFGGGC